MMKLLVSALAFVGLVGCSSTERAGTAGADAGSDTRAGGNPSCTAAKETLLKPIDAISNGEVKIVSEAGGVKTLFIDATAGGIQGAETNPRIYVNLETGTRVDVTDVSAASSPDWDLALERPIIFTNSGDGGSGQGGAALVAKAFESVSASDAGDLAPESFFEAGDDCTAKLDATSAVRTSFDGWYDYEPAKMHLTPHAGTWIVRGGTGTLYKVAITSFYANPDGTEGKTSGRYTLKVAAL